MKKNLIIGGIWINRMKRPEWIDFPHNITLANQNVIKNYIGSLEEEIKTLSHELESYKRQMFIFKEKERLTTLWAKGELEN